MRTVDNIPELRAQVAKWRRQGERIALVPTMGNLHPGHLALVAEARRNAGRVVVSIFVNPLQFGPKEDFSSYPRTLVQDSLGLEQAGADLLFAPPVGVVYPSGQASHTRIEVPGLSEVLCGAARPGHFVGVATVVCKLLNMALPDFALFGEKDFQQLAVIRRMVEDLCLPVQIAGLATVREADGLAMSSRNGYLTAEEREQAPALYRTLRWVAEQIGRGTRDLVQLESGAAQRLREAGFEPEYVSIRRAADLAEPAPEDTELVVLGAARLGRARLIDNLRI